MLRKIPLALLSVSVLATGLMLADDPDVVLKNRREMLSARRVARSDHTMLAVKNHYFKEAIAETAQDGRRPTLATVSLRMSELEPSYRLPYRWGGSIKNHMDGLDCTGFVHGILHYLVLPGGERRLNTRALYFKLKRDGAWQKVYDASDEPPAALDPAFLKPGDVVLWPSDITDGKNLPGPIWGHVGIVVEKDGVLEVTHFVNSEAYNDLDTIGLPGPGINTVPAAQFVSLKQRGILTVFRLRQMETASSLDR